MTLGEDGTQHGSDLLPILYRSLRGYARSLMRKLPPGDTLQPTALVHEAYLRLQRSGSERWDSEAHFFGSAANAMRQILVDRARHKASLKAGGHLSREDAEIADLRIESPVVEILALEEALSELERLDPECAQVVLLRFFAGKSIDEIAVMLELSRRTIERRWTFAQRFLRVRLGETRHS